MALIVTTHSNDVTTVVLNRPEKKNAFSRTMIEELKKTFQDLKPQAESSQVRAVVIRSADATAFCAGADLQERLAMSEAQVLEILDLQLDTIQSVANCPVPVIAVVEGIAFGGGLELALACDLRIFGPGAKVGLTESALGIIPGAGGTQRLMDAVGPARAKELIYLARAVSAGEALSWGLCHHIDNEPSALAQQWAERISRNGPVAIRASKRAIDGGLDQQSMAERLRWERSCYMKVLSTQDRLEGLRSFQEKRKPQFSGN